MSAAIDLMQREIRELKKLLNARESGIPETLVVIVKGDAAKSAEGRTAAVKTALLPYGLETAEDALAAGCTVKLALLPYLGEDDRQLPKRPNEFGEPTDGPHRGPNTGDDSGAAEEIQDTKPDQSSADSLASGSQSPSQAIAGSLNEGMTA